MTYPILGTSPRTQVRLGVSLSTQENAVVVTLVFPSPPQDTSFEIVLHRGLSGHWDVHIAVTGYVLTFSPKDNHEVTDDDSDELAGKVTDALGISGYDVVTT